MKNPNPVNLQTSLEVREKGWQAESRDADGHLISCHAPIEADDPSIAEWIVECTSKGETVTFWPALSAALTPPPESHLRVSEIIAKIRHQLEINVQIAEDQYPEGPIVDGKRVKGLTHSQDILAQHIRDHLSELELAIVSPAPAPSTHLISRWLPVEQADKSVERVIDLPDLGLKLTNSENYWMRDADGRTFHATWADDGKRAYWWDFEGESPVDPVEFMPHPLDPRWAALASEGRE